MKKTKNFFYFKLISNFRIAIIFFIVFGFNFNFSFGEGAFYSNSPERGNKQNPYIIHSLTDNEKKLRDNLIKAGFITKPRRIDDPSLTRFLYSVSSENKPVNKQFKKECQMTYDFFSNRRNDFIQRLNIPSNQNQNGNHSENITQNINNCIKKITDNYNELEKEFIKPFNSYYASTPTQTQTPGGIHVSSCYSKNIDTLYDKSIQHLSINNNSPKNIQEIRKLSNQVKNFYNLCHYRSGLQILQGSFIPDYICFPPHSRGNEQDFTLLKQYFEKTINNKSCYAKRQELMKLATGPNFQKFINLPGQCKRSNENNYNPLKSASEDCKNMINKLEPKYTTEDNKNTNNLFYKCNEYVSTAYTECFGEEGKRNDLQEILYLIDQKSPSVCDDNKIDRSQRALESCLTAVKKCTDACHTQIEDFKKDFLQCFFLPDFKLNSYTTLHRHNTCKDRIEKLRNSFINQAKEAPFKVENSRFDTLDSPSKNRSSIAYKIYKACENPLEERQLEKKRNEMRKICREQKQEEKEEKEEQKNQQQIQLQQQNPFTDTTTSNTNTNTKTNNKDTNDSSSDDEGTKTKGQNFDYNKNQGFNPNHNSNWEEQQNQNSGSPIATVPSDPNSDTKKDDDSLKKDTSTEEFTGGADSLENTLSSIENDISKNGSQRGLSSSDGSLGGEEELSSEETTSETEQSEGNPVSSTIRKILSTDKEYGVVNENAYSQQSATQGFFDWMGKKADQAKKVAGNAYDKMVGVGPRAFQEKLHLNNKSVNLFELQGNMFKKACSEHKCPTETSSEPQQISSQ